MTDVSDYSAEALVNDGIEVLEYLTERFPNTSLIIVGHSMGGSIATKTAKAIFDQREQYKSAAMIKGRVEDDCSVGRDRRCGRGRTRSPTFHGQHCPIQTQVFPHFGVSY